jgi:hypothetical protein
MVVVFVGISIQMPLFHGVQYASSMKNGVLLLLFFAIGFFGLLLINQWRQNDKIKAAQIAIPVVTKKIPFSLDDAPSQSLKGSIDALSGDTTYISRTATEPASLASDHVVQQGEVFETGDSGSIRLSLSDQTQALLASNTSLSLVQSLPENIVFEQSSGSVTYAKTSTDPLSVTSLHLVTLLKDSGSMRVTIGSDLGIVTVRVIKGSASVAYNSLDAVANKTEVSEDQSYSFNDSLRTGELNP